uniref:Inhibitor of growth family, member 5a n=1 Tax=Gasterosteus aculeatus aculeatus TaxID=481459 RepID=G3PAK5_GASAC
MATAIYLEHYLDSIENLPCELQRNFTLMRDLDNRTEEKKGEIDQLAEEYVVKVKNFASEQRVEHLQKIQNAYSKCKEFSDDKVQLAMQTYEMVDKHIRRLDADLARFENELKEKLELSGYESTEGRSVKKPETRGLRDKRASRGRAKKASDEDSPKKKKIKNSPELSDALLPMQPSDVLDMPVDPNEPTYCLCHQVSYGEMIGCDNPDVMYDRVVSLRLCRSRLKTQRKMVLSALHPRQEEEMRRPAFRDPSRVTRLFSTFSRFCLQVTETKKKRLHFSAEILSEDYLLLGPSSFYQETNRKTSITLQPAAAKHADKNPQRQRV